MFREVSIHAAIQARQEQTPEGTKTGERSQTLVVRKERFLENPSSGKMRKLTFPPAAGGRMN
jgi:hypothetical protein